MYKNITMITLLIMFFIQPVMAAQDASMDSSSDGKSCATLAKACKKAGYSRKGESGKFWFDCMKPILLGKTVSKVKIDASIVKACRDKKITKMKKELEELQQVQ
jgi:hypothetical protein